MQRASGCGERDVLRSPKAALGSVRQPRTHGSIGNFGESCREKNGWLQRVVAWNSSGWRQGLAVPGLIQSACAKPSHKTVPVKASERESSLERNPLRGRQGRQHLHRQPCRPPRLALLSTGAALPAESIRYQVAMTWWLHGAWSPPPRRNIVLFCTNALFVRSKLSFTNGGATP